MGPIHPAARNLANFERDLGPLFGENRQQSPERPGFKTWVT